MFDPNELPSSLPRLHAQDGLPNALAHARLFLPGTRWEWFLTEWDRGDDAFGLVAGAELELGYISIRELRQLQASIELRINTAPDEGGYRVFLAPTHVVIDKSFRPTPVAELRVRIEATR